MIFVIGLRGLPEFNPACGGIKFIQYWLYSICLIELQIINSLCVNLLQAILKHPLYHRRKQIGKRCSHNTGLFGNNAVGRQTRNRIYLNEVKFGSG